MDRTSVMERYGPTQRRMLQNLLHAPAGLSVEKFASDLGLTPGAVRQHLTALERDGMVERTGQQPTRGRPERLYSLTTRGREAFPRSYRQLAESLLEEVGRTIGADKLVDVMRRMGKRAGNSARGTGGPVPLEATAAVMQQEGYEAEVSADDKNEIVAHNCVFHSLAAQFPAVCEFDLAFLEAATGATVEHRECMVRGGAVCRFAFKRGN